MPEAQVLRSLQEQVPYYQGPDSLATPQIHLPIGTGLTLEDTPLRTYGSPSSLFWV